MWHEHSCGSKCWRLHPNHKKQPQKAINTRKIGLKHKGENWANFFGLFSRISKILETSGRWWDWLKFPCLHLQVTLVLGQKGAEICVRNEWVSKWVWQMVGGCDVVTHSFDVMKWSLSYKALSLLSLSLLFLSLSLSSPSLPLSLSHTCTNSLQKDTLHMHAATQRIQPLYITKSHAPTPTNTAINTLHMHSLQWHKQHTLTECTNHKGRFIITCIAIKKSYTSQLWATSEASHAT